MKRNIIVFGATGKTGIHICEELLSRNIESSAFVRAESSNKLKDKGMRILRGDVLSEKDVEAAFMNETYTDVIIALGSKELKKSVTRSKGTEHIIRAMSLNQTKSKLHIVSALGVGDSWDQLKWHSKLMSNILLKSVMNDHQQQEELVKSSSYPYHIIRPVGLKDGKSSRGIHVQPEGFLPGNTIMRVDLAIYLIDSMVENKTGESSVCQK